MLTENQKKTRGWYYVNKEKYYWRDCDSCGLEYRGMGSNFCSRKCSSNLKLIEEEDGTVTVGLRERSTGHNYGDKISKAKRGKPNLKIRGSLHHNWKDGMAKRRRYEREKEMCTARYREWRTAVFASDNFKCVICGKGGRLQAHHILSWRDFPLDRYDIDNGVTVCQKHHPVGKQNEDRMVERFSSIVKQRHIWLGAGT